MKKQTCFSEAKGRDPPSEEKHTHVEERGGGCEAKDDYGRGERTAREGETEIFAAENADCKNGGDEGLVCEAASAGGSGQAEAGPFETVESYHRPSGLPASKRKAGTTERVEG